MARSKRHPARPPLTTGLWFHPQRGAYLSLDKPDPDMWKRRGGSPGLWREVARVRVVETLAGLVPAPGQTPPKGFLWADATKQFYGLGGAYPAYGPLARTCRTCGKPFTWSARAQKQLYEVARANIEVIALDCQRCARTAKDYEAKREAYVTALRALEQQPSVDAHLAVAEAILALVKAGGRASLDRAIGHCSRARRLGRPDDRLEAKLRELRASR
jgi:hypothetical protein